MQTRAFYLAKAEECRAAAAASADTAERIALLKIAQSYLLLADYVSRQETGSYLCPGAFQSLAPLVIHRIGSGLNPTPHSP
jgi:hypothetical protein